MLLRVQTEVSGDVFILRCDGRIVFGDEGAVLRDRVINLLSGTPKIVVNLNGVDYIDSGGFGTLVGLFISAKKTGWRPQAGLSQQACHGSAPTHQSRHHIQGVRERRRRRRSLLQTSSLTGSSR